MRKLGLVFLFVFSVAAIPFAAFGVSPNVTTCELLSGHAQITTTNLDPFPLFTGTFQQDATLGNPNVKVWVNTKSGVYHCPGTRWYGNTKQGVYMTQAEAQKKGYRPAYGKVCQ